MSRTTDILRRHAREEALLERVDAGYQPKRGWELRAYCRNMKDGRWFADGDAWKHCEPVCRYCPVRLDCLAEALECEQADIVNVHFFRAITPSARRAWLRRNRKRVGKPIAHGTNAGYSQHRRLGVPLDDACGCREAHNVYVKLRKRPTLTGTGAAAGDVVSC